MDPCGRRRGAERTDDAGTALVTVVLLTSGFLALSMLVAHLAMQGILGASVDRKRIVSIAAAEAGLDTAFSLIKAGTGNRCTVTGQLPGTGFAVGTYSVAVTYYDSSNATVSCDPTTGPASGVVSATLQSTGSTVNAAYSGAALVLGSRKLTARLAIVESTSSGAAPTALFSEASLTVSGGGLIYDTDGNAATSLATVYTNGNFYCTNGGTEIVGAVQAPKGTGTMDGGCIVRGDLTASGLVYINNSGTSVDGSVYSTANSLSMEGGSVVKGNAKVNGTITLNNSGTAIYGTQTQGAATSSFPDLRQPFPYQWYDTTVWDAAGFTQKVDVGTSCTNVASYASAAPSTAGAKIAIKGACALGSATITAKTDVALFLTNGFDGTLTIASDDPSVKRNVYLIVPAGTSAKPTNWTPPTSCSTGNTTLQGGTTSASSINLYVYTPCALTVVPAVDLYGQLFGGALDPGSSSGTVIRFVDVSVPGEPTGSSAPASVTMSSRTETS